jgi:cytochrome c551/c552
LRQLRVLPDAAVHQLNQAGAGSSLADVVDAYAAVAQAASELADALQAAGE